MAHPKASGLMQSAALPILVLMLALRLETANCLECYRCVSNNNTYPFLCTEFMTNTEDIHSEPCDDVFNAKFCVKQVGRFEGGIGAKRFCSSVDLGNYCDYVQLPGDKLSYRTCVYTCESDSCNLGSILSPSILLNSFLSIMSFKFFIQK